MISEEKNEKKNNFRVKDKESQHPITRQREERENHNTRLRKSKSADKGMAKSR